MGGEAFIPQGGGDINDLEHISGELAHRLAARSFAAVHVDGQADD